jgi:hypothetical protein
MLALSVRLRIEERRRLAEAGTDEQVISTRVPALRHSPLRCLECGPRDGACKDRFPVRRIRDLMVQEPVGDGHAAGTMAGGHDDVGLPLPMSGGNGCIAGGGASARHSAAVTKAVIAHTIRAAAKSNRRQSDRCNIFVISRARPSAFVCDVSADCRSLARRAQASKHKIAPLH